MWRHLNDLSEKEYEPSSGTPSNITSGLSRYRFAIMVWSKHIDIKCHTLALFVSIAT